MGHLFEFSVMFSSDREKKHTPWVYFKPQNNIEKRAIILGAGLAGAYLSRYLAEQGWHIDLLDRENKPASGASANSRMILFPTLSSYSSPLTRWMLQAFLYAIPKCKSAIDQGVEGEWNGIAQLAWDDASLKRMQALLPWLTHYPALGQVQSAAVLSETTGLNLSSPGLYIPNSGWLNAIDWCQQLISHPNIHCGFGQSVEDVHYERAKWRVEGYSAPVLMIAAGIGSDQFEWTRFLNLKPKKGQMTEICRSPDFSSLKIPICAACHLLPEREGGQWIGATFSDNFLEKNCTEAEDLQNIAQLTRCFSPKYLIEKKNHWSGIRATTFDHLPMIGPVPDVQAFRLDFKALSKDSNAFVPKQGTYWPGLYLFTGFGARGLTSIPLGASILSAQLQGQPTGVSRKMLESIAPARVLIRGLIRE